MFIFGHAPMRQIEQITTYLINNEYKNYVILLPTGRHTQIVSKIIQNIIANKETRKGMMPLSILFEIIAADPTSRVPEGMTAQSVKPEDMEKVKIGKYTQWILKNFTSPKIESDSGITDPNSPASKQALKEYQDLFLEDLYKVTGDLMKFERFKSRLPQEARDINKLTTETLYDYVKDFSLEKTKATKDEKVEASRTYQHPGAEIVYRGSEWTVARISDQGQLGKDAACFYGGNYLEPQRGETRWCTSSPGLTWFDRYIKDGPLYVVSKSEIRYIKYSNGHVDSVVSKIKTETPETLTIYNGPISPYGNEKIVISGSRLSHNGKAVGESRLYRLISNVPIPEKKAELYKEYLVMKSYKKRQYLFGFVGLGAGLALPYIGLMSSFIFDDGVPFAIGLAAGATIGITGAVLSGINKHKRTKKRIDIANLYNN